MTAHEVDRHADGILLDGLLRHINDALHDVNLPPLKRAQWEANQARVKRAIESLNDGFAVT